MKQDDFDIPEVFRRAMEEAGWRAEQEGGGRRPPRRTVSPPSRPRGFNRTLLLIFLALLLIFSVSNIASFYTDYLWFDVLGFRDLFVKRLTVRIAVFAVGFVLAAAIFLGNWLLARRQAIRVAGSEPGVLADSRLRSVIVGVAVVLAFLCATAAAANWEELLLYLNAEPFDMADPIFGRDISFYIFAMPVLRLLHSWLGIVLLMALIGVVLLYVVARLSDFQRGRWQSLISPELRRHASILGGVLLLLWAGGYLFDIYNLLYSTRGVAVGAAYTDTTAVLWALRAQLAFAALTALFLFYNAFRPSPRLLLGGVGLWVVAAVVGGALLPGLLQRYTVEPNELTLEEPFIRYNIDLTRFAFGLDKVETREFGQVDDLQPADLLDNEEVLRNIRLWDWRPLQQTYRQLQGLRPYYEFNDVDVDRYTIDGEQRQVMVGARELDKSKLPAPSWVNRNLEFTHGYGLVMNPVNEVSPEGQPEFFIQDFPPASRVEIEVTRPEIYYGEMTFDTVYVSSSRQEFDYPSGDENVYTNYEGEGGVVLDSFVKRLAFALRQSDPNVMLNNDITSTTRAQYQRQIQERIRQLTPFLVLDADPYLVVNDDGRLFWIQDAYTVSDAFPYATPVRFTERPSATPPGSSSGQFNRTHTINYIRNSVKIITDAYHGSVTYYLADDTDPIILSYDRAFPGLFRAMDEMPDDLAAHLRYPEDLFSIQARQYITYHMTNVRVFYNKEDLWQIPTEISETGEGLVEPYYVTLPLPSSTEPEYLLIMPFNPATRNNMIGWMAARNDPGVYGQLIVYELPKQELIFGPLQIEGRIDQEPVISQQFSLWNQRGSGVIRGNLLVLPIGNSFLYIEPIYLLSETSALPELKRIVTASNTAIAMEETLDESLLTLAAGGATTLLPLPGEEDVPAPTTPATPRPTPPAVPETLDELVAAANAHLRAAEAAQRDGDWATYGRELDSLRAVLDQLATLLEQSE